MNELMLEVIDDSDLDLVAGGLGFGINFESSLLNATVSANTSHSGINLSACLNLLGLNFGLNVGATVG